MKKFAIAVLLVVVVAILPTNSAAMDRGPRETSEIFNNADLVMLVMSFIPPLTGIFNFALTNTVARAQRDRVVGPALQAFFAEQPEGQLESENLQIVQLHNQVFKVLHKNNHRLGTLVLHPFPKRPVLEFSSKQTLAMSYSSKCFLTLEYDEEIGKMEFSATVKNTCELIPVNTHRGFLPVLAEIPARALDVPLAWDQQSLPCAVVVYVDSEGFVGTCWRLTNDASATLRHQPRCFDVTHDTFQIDKIATIQIDVLENESFIRARFMDAEGQFLFHIEILYPS